MACCGTAADFPLLLLDTLPYVHLGAVGVLLGFLLCSQSSQPYCASLPHLQNRKWPSISQKRGQRPLFVQCIEGIKRTTALPWYSEYNQSLVAGSSRKTHLIFVWKSLQPIQSEMACSYPITLQTAVFIGMLPCLFRCDRFPLLFGSNLPHFVHSKHCLPAVLLTSPRHAGHQGD